MREADPFGMSPEMTEDKDSFFWGEKVFFTGNEAAAILPNLELMENPH